MFTIRLEVSEEKGRLILTWWFELGVFIEERRGEERLVGMVGLLLLLSRTRLDHVDQCG